MQDQSRKPDLNRIDRLTAALLLGSVLWFVFKSIHWPLIGDASLIRYVNLLLSHGWAPYRQIADINLPGAYALDWLVLHTLGPTDLAWRVYDLLLLALAALAIHRITRPFGWFPGLWAWTLFSLIHGRDGLLQVGQRDLAVALLLLLGVAALLKQAAQTAAESATSTLLFSLAVGAATTVKPSAIPFALLAVPVLLDLRRSRLPLTRPILATLLGLLLPWIATALWLIHHNALAAFLGPTRVLIAFHAPLGRRSLPYLLQHSLSPVLPVAALWIVLRLWSHPPRPAPSLDIVEDQVAPQDLTRHILALASILGLLGYVLQAKGYPYHRYSFLAFFLPLLAIDLSDLRRHRRPYSIPAATVLCASALLLAPISAIKISRYDWQNRGNSLTLQADILAAQRTLGLPTLSGRVQCLDTVAGCLEALLRARLLPSTGTFYDEFLFQPSIPGVTLSPSALANPPASSATGQSRQAFLAGLAANPPEVLVVTAPLFPSGPDDFAKLHRWPDLDRWIAARYTLAVERPALPPARWGSPSSAQPGYRLYLRNRAEAERHR